MHIRKSARTALLVGSLLLGTGITFAAEPGSQAPQPALSANASNMGLCSAYLGQQQVRDDVNQLIKQFGDFLGIGSPGELYRIRAKQHDTATPEEECERRTLP